MGTYLNPDNSKFQETVNSDIYVDKTGLLRYTNSVIHTLQKYICVSRPRRFGKSVTAAMLSAYYSCGCDSEALFSSFEMIDCFKLLAINASKTSSSKILIILLSTSLSKSP